MAKSLNAWTFARVAVWLIARVYAGVYASWRQHRAFQSAALSRITPRALRRGGARQAAKITGGAAGSAAAAET
jgi:hypothetical protein